MEITAIDMEKYPRKSHFEYFKSMKNPHVGVTADVDVTNFVKFCKDRNCSFYLAFVHAVALAADGVEQFRQRIAGDGIVQYSECGTSHTESAGDGTYCYCTLYHHMAFEDYIKYAENERMLCREKNSVEEDANVDSLYFISTLPWISYSDIVMPTDGLNDTNPRITWGKYKEDFKGRLMMPVSVLCNHAIVDGINIAEFYENLDAEMKRIISE